MVSNQNTNIFIFQLPHNLLNILYRNRVNSCKRFIEHDKLRINSKTASNLRTAALTTRKLITLILTHFLQTKLRNQTFQLFFLIFQRLICHFKYRSNVIFHTHLAEYGCFLCQISDSGLRTLVHRIFRNIQIIQKDTSLIRCNQSNGHIE